MKYYTIFNYKLGLRILMPGLLLDNDFARNVFNGGQKP